MTDVYVQYVSCVYSTSGQNLNGSQHGRKNCFREETNERLNSAEQLFLPTFFDRISSLNIQG